MGTAKSASPKGARQTRTTSAATGSRRAATTRTTSAASKSPATVAKKPGARQAAGKTTKPTVAAAARSDPKPASSAASKVAPEASGIAAKSSAATLPAAPAANRDDVNGGKSRVKAKKVKVVRDSFTMPETEYAAFAEVKKRCLSSGFSVKKSELLRVGMALIRTLDAEALKTWVESLPSVKAGRPRKDK